MSMRFALITFVLAATATAGGAATLPVPDGPYAVGVARTEFVDAARRLDVDDPASGPRRLPTVVWYPAEGPRGGDAPYAAPDVAATSLPGLARTFAWTPEELKPVLAARQAVRPDAPPVRRAGAFPVVVFSHGLLMYPEQNSALAARLASHGFVVVSIAHPLDAADQRLADGHVVASHFDISHDDPRFNGAFDTLVAGADLVDRRAALEVYAQAMPATRLGRSLQEWRADTLAVARAIVDGRETGALHAALVSADRTRLAFAGMSFGGATAATSCRLLPQCLAAVNLDGQNFDPALFDAPVGRPLLLLLSDWPRYGLLKGQPRDEAFSPNDLAYEPWASAGTNPDVLRVRLEGVRHLGFTDLVALLDGEKRNARVGDIDGAEALASVDDLVLAFLEFRLRGIDQGGVERALRQHSSLQRHVPVRMKAWTGR